MQGKYPEIVFLVLKAILIYQDDQTAATIYTPSKENLKKKKKLDQPPFVQRGMRDKGFLSWKDLPKLTWENSKQHYSLHFGPTIQSKKA